MINVKILFFFKISNNIQANESQARKKARNQSKIILNKKIYFIRFASQFGSFFSKLYKNNI